MATPVGEWGFELWHDVLQTEGRPALPEMIEVRRTAAPGVVRRTEFVELPAFTTAQKGIVLTVAATMMQQRVLLAMANTCL
jgi:hypothetical protein